jgi:fibronectin-binding autotransporter adhesin
VIPDGATKGDVTVTGTLDLNGNSETINGLSGAGTVDTIAGGTPTLTVGNDNDTSTFSGTIQDTAGTLGLAKTGSGTLTLSGANTYTGATTVNGGVLVLDENDNTYHGGVININGATLRLDNQTGTYLFGPGESLNFGASGGGALEIVSGHNHVWSGNNTVTTTGGAENTMIGGDINSNSGGAAGTLTFNVANGDDDSDLTVSFRIYNGGSVLKTGAGVLTLSDANAYTGTTTIDANGGTLQLGSGGTAGSLSTSSAISIGSGATFAVNQSDTVTQGTDFSGAAISGAGGFAQNGGGTTVLTANNGYTGTTDINDGILELQSTSGFHSYLGGDININNGSTLQFSNNGGAGYVLDAADTINFDSNGGGLFKVVSGNFVVRGSTITTAGGSENTIQGTFNMDTGGDVVFDVTAGDDPVDLTVSALLSNSQGIEKQGAGVMALSGANTYTGDTTVNGGVLKLASGGSLSTATTVLIASGAAMDLDVNQTVDKLYLNGALQSAGTWGSTSSGAQNKNNTYFAGTGILTVSNGTGGTLFKFR